MIPGSHYFDGIRWGSHFSHWTVGRLSTSIACALDKTRVAVLSLGGEMTVISYSCTGILGVMFFQWNPSGYVFFHGNHRRSYHFHGSANRGSYSSQGNLCMSYSSHDPFLGYILPLIPMQLPVALWFIILSSLLDIYPWSLLIIDEVSSMTITLLIVKLWT